MARKRLRPFLDEVITDVELHATAQDISDAAPPRDPESFPPPPWERPPAPVSLAGNGHIEPAAEGAPASPALDVVPVREPLVAIEPATAVAPAEIALAATAAPPSARPDLPTAAERRLAEPPVPVDMAPAVAHADPVANGRRRRRSATLLPPLPSATDVPEDAPGRVAIVAVPLPPEAAAASESSPPAPVQPAPITVVGGEAPLAGWLPVLALGVALVILFVVGVLVTR